jgi:hypothetical protein
MSCCTTSISECFGSWPTILVSRRFFAIFARFRFPSLASFLCAFVDLVRGGSGCSFGTVCYLVRSLAGLESRGIPVLWFAPLLGKPMGPLLTASTAKCKPRCSQQQPYTTSPR